MTTYGRGIQEPIEHERINDIHNCVLQGKKCLRVFIKTRKRQPNLCVKCMEELELLEHFPLPKKRSRRNFWK